MSAPARLTALRVVGFKSFAERTSIEFGAGISAVIGPNGSGKSNLADALRWTLGEAGRSLRTRRSEDVIFAGSSTRRATSMADVTIVLDNGDRLLPLDYGQVELGRRLFRSGENEYLLNRQRIRLRDLVELLDVGNLADNAFLFIGQGMVDQALALRPEERRPLFEEAAGVRRHERRRRQAEAELIEAEANLERLRDVLAELRPQARRLAAQADQLQARRSAGQELAEALVAAARSRWALASAGAVESQAALDDAHQVADTALSDLRAADADSQRLNRALADHVEAERLGRHRLDERHARTLELRLELTRLAADIAALERDRQRIADERAALAARAGQARARLAETARAADSEADDDLAGEVDHLTAELRRLEAEQHGNASALERARQAETARREDRQRSQRRLEALQDELGQLVARVDPAAAAATDADRAHKEAAARLAAGREASERAQDDDAAARACLADLLAQETGPRVQASAAEARLAALQAGAAQVERELAEVAGQALQQAALSRGGRLLIEGVEVDPRLSLALAAALGDAVNALVVARDVVAHLPITQGTVVVAGDGQRLPAPAEALIAAARAIGGGLLVEAVRADPAGHVRALVARTVWVEDLAAALDLGLGRPPGWQVVTVSGQALSDQGILRLAASDRALRLREEAVRLRREMESATAGLEDARHELAAAAAARGLVEQAARQAAEATAAALRDLRQAEEAERSAQRRAEATAAEHSRLATRLADLRRAMAEVEAALRSTEPAGSISPASATAAAGTGSLAAHIAQLRQRSASLVEQQAQRRAVRRAADDARRRAEVALVMGEERELELDAQAVDLAGRLAAAGSARQRVSADLAAAEAAESEARAELERAAGQAAADRALLVDVDRRAGAARERLRAAENASRAAEVAAMEARLQLETQRETLLVELAAIGRQALAALDHDPSGDQQPDGDLDADRLADALDLAMRGWQQDLAPQSAAGPGRIAALRRRFHELGAGNPFAVEEYAEVSARLSSLDAQQVDLESAIGATRHLIEDLNRLIADQFRTTFAALEGAFARRFSQLFDGGEAQLSLTAPDDLSATGVEITARPPGKKRQPLQMLSGGERALTAVALLLAMLEVRPVPFCVLDEVDAALDEANIGRFAQALRSLAGQTQFIVITHNRGTIEAADALYGVTIGDDAVSRIVSLRLPSAGGNGHGDAELADTAVEVGG